MHLEEKIKAAEDRIKELELLIEYWKEQIASVSKQ
jgi:FtsZ-binding cell division protein ZapB